MQVYCRVEVVVRDPGAVTALAEQRLRAAAIDWPSERDTLQEAAAELRADLLQSVAGLVEPDGLLDGVPGVELRRARWWAERGAPSPRFQPGFDDRP